MSLIIKGMQLPRKSERRECSIAVVQNRPVSIAFSRTETNPTECFECAEIPAPHGRLIDADAHIKLLKENHCGERCRRNHNCFSCGIDMYIRIVENEPTVIKAEGVNE